MAKVKKAAVIAVLEELQEKDFEALMQSVDTAIEDEEKAKVAYQKLNPATCTVQQKEDLLRRWRLATVTKTAKLTSFYEFMTGKSKHYNGRTFNRRKQAEGETK